MDSKSRAAIRIGVSGWRYPHWRGGAFYPAKLPQRRELEYLSRRVRSLEINGSFYSLLRPQTYAGYREQVPAAFRFAVKGGRFITHSKKLADVEIPLANFLASGVLCLEDRLGPMLWQLPAMALDTARVERFLALLPQDTMAAARLARRHDHRVRGRSSLRVERNRPLRHALEVRHDAHLTEPVVRACRRHGVALVTSHNGGEWPWVEEPTSSWMYLRLHGAPRTYGSDYGADAVSHWADRVLLWARGSEPADARRVTGHRGRRRKSRDVYVYFDNDGEARAPWNALALQDSVSERLQRESASV